MSVERARERGRGECDLANPCQRCRLQQKQAAFAKFPQRMRKLIFSQALRCIFTHSKHNILSNRKSVRLHRLCCTRSSGIRMHSYLTEVIAKARLKEITKGLRKRLTSTPKVTDLSFQARRDFGTLNCVLLGLKNFFFFLLY